jgi:hypothetical protein
VSGGNGPAAAVRPHADERILYALAHHMRRGDPAAADDLVATLSEPERAAARELLGVPGVAETLRMLSEDELRARMLALAGKTREAHVSEPQREVTTILPGGRGVPTIVVREPGWEQQAAAEREARRRAETGAEVKRIERERAIRESPFTPRPPLLPTDPVAQVHAEWERQKWLDECAELRDVPRKQAELEEWARKVELERAMDSPDPPPPMRYGRPVSKAQLNYEAQQADYQAKQASHAGRGCGYCNTCRNGGGQFCLYG